MTVADVVGAGPVIPVIVIDRADTAVPLAEALAEGGVHTLEITLRTPAALPAVAAIARALPAAMVGVGTITTPDDLRRSIDAGARFGVSPGLTPALADAARVSGLPLLPGVMTPSELMAARAHGFTTMKFFPAAQAGGIAMLKALAGPFADVRFCPTGGITTTSAPEYLALPNVVCVGGSWLTPGDALRDGDWRRVTSLARAAAALRDEPRPR